MAIIAETKEERAPSWKDSERWWAEVAEVMETTKVMEAARESEPFSSPWGPSRGGGTEAFLVG